MRVSSSGDVQGETGPAKTQGEGTPEIVGGCAELVAVESWRVGDAPTLSSTQRAARHLNKNLNRRVPLVLESVTWLVIWSCVVRLRRCCDHAVEGKSNRIRYTRLQMISPLPLPCNREPVHEVAVTVLLIERSQRTLRIGPYEGINRA